MILLPEKNRQAESLRTLSQECFVCVISCISHWMESCSRDFCRDTVQLPQVLMQLAIGLKQRGNLMPRLRAVGMVAY